LHMATIREKQYLTGSRGQAAGRRSKEEICNDAGQATGQRNRFYAICITFFCLAYFLFQLFNNQFACWNVDDFWFAHRIYQFKANLPYRDFAPYKTVLGYYILLPSMIFGHDALSPLLYTKNLIAVLNTACFALTGYWLTKFFPKNAVLITLALMMSAVFVLNYSTNIRVDLLAYWLCLFSALFLLSHQFVRAGIMLACGFLISQKVLWYIAASDIALVVYWLLGLVEQFARLQGCQLKHGSQLKTCWGDNNVTFWGIVVFNIIIALPIVIYVAIWSWFAGLDTVLHSVFYEAYVMFQLDSYESARKLFWWYTLQFNAFIFLIWPISFLTLFASPPNDTLHGKRIFIVTYATVIMFCLIPFKQIFPYYMLTTLPAFLLLYAAFFSWIFALFQHSSPPKLYILDKTAVWGLILIYLFSFSYLCIIFSLSLFYLLISLIPVLLGYKITTQKNSTLLIAMPTLIFIITFFIGIAYPLTIFFKHFQPLSRDYQKSMVQLTEALLKDGSDYLAGIELIYNKNQPIPGLRHLDVPALSYLFNPTPKLANAMLASLYHTPDISIEKAIQYLDTSSVKFYVNNYRLEALPKPIKNYLDLHYTHFWGSIYLYAPLIEPKQDSFLIKFPGHYRVQSAKTIQIDHTPILPNSTINLSRGVHSSRANEEYRLVLLETQTAANLNPQYKMDHWEKMFN
ncbi:MAG TPA: hypothetical protein VL201_01755, partial [Patescibacteria group bacterium]|nr:hypothetical protein [Patescibacteria group bacterium]